MRLRTNTGLYCKGRTGGLFLDTGAGPMTFLPLPPPVLERIAGGDDADAPGVTTIRTTINPITSSSMPGDDDDARRYPARTIDVEVCFVCKKCRVAFAGESALLVHQRQCFGGAQDARGAFRIVQPGFECTLCPGAGRFKTLAELRTHCETSEQHLQVIHGGGGGALPIESPLSHEMEDVVNQITLLAARAAQEAAPPPPPPDPKRRFLPPPPPPPPPPHEALTNAGH